MTPQIVLVVEDNPTTRKLVRLILGNEGFTVIEAADAAEALAACSRTTPDLILQDLLLPDMDGFDLVRMLRDRPEIVGVPIIAFSGFLSRLEHSRASAVGFTDFLPKPVEASRLVQVVRGHLAAPDLVPSNVGKGQRVLVADDDAVQLKLARLRLVGLGFDVATATNGVEALEVLRSGGVAAVMSDVLMPEMDGFRLCEEIRKDPLLSRVPIVLVSSNYIEEADRRVAHSMGANAFVVRTPDLSGAIAALVDVLSCPPVPRSVRPEPAAHHDRVVRQLERQSAMNATLAHRSAVHASMLSVMAGISEALTHAHDVETSLPDLLASLLEASGVSKGALFLTSLRAGASGVASIDDLAMSASSGFPDAVVADLRTFCGDPESFAHAVATKTPVVIGGPGRDGAAERALLHRAQVASALLVPFVADQACLGLLLLGSSARNLTETDWLPFARTMAVQIGQALALSRAFSKLAASESRYKALMKCAVDGIFTLDSGGRVLDANPAFERLLGCSREQLVGRELGDLVAPDDRDRSRIALASMMERGHARVTGGRFLRSSGATVTTDISASVVTIDGDPVVLGIVRDVSERERAEEQNRLLSTLTLAASEAADFRSALEVVLRMVCEAYGWMFGAAWVPSFDGSALECIGQWTRDPNDRSRFSTLAEPRFAMGEGVLGRVWASRKPTWVHDVDSEPDYVRSVSASALGLRAGFAVPVVAGSEVVTVIELFNEKHENDERVVALVTTAAAQLASVLARKRAETSLVERVKIATLTAEVALALARNDALEDILRICAEAIVRHFEGAFARIWTLGKSKEMLDLQATAGAHVHLDGSAASVPVGKLKIGLIASQRKPHLTNDVLHDPWISDPEWARREGMTAFAGHPLLVGGDLVGVMAVYSKHLLTETSVRGLASIADAIAVGIQRKRAEASNLALEAQLRHAQKMEAVGLLAGGVAHDFNNLLSVILGYGEMLLMDLPSEAPIREGLEEIQKAGKRAADLTRQLLMFSRQQVLQPQVLDLNDVLVSLGKMLQRLVGEHVDLVWVPGHPLGRARVDPGSIEQVVMNLVINARDAMATGGTITMETANVVLDDEYSRSHVGAKAGPHIMLAVSDNGVGMDAETQSRIFEPFFTTKAQGKGTGLGLSTVFGIVQQSGGSIWVHSEPRNGTTIKVFFPRVEAVLDAVGTAQPGAGDRGTETVLLVEDDAQVRAVVRGILGRLGYNVIEARDPSDALRIAAQTLAPIELLLTDVVMPTMSGPELARRITVARPEIRVLCMSGYTDDTIIRHGLLEGSVAYLQKPITTDALAKKVREVLGAPLDQAAE